MAFLVGSRKTYVFVSSGSWNVVLNDFKRLEGGTRTSVEKRSQGGEDADEELA
jgi:hypothetical protein